MGISGLLPLLRSITTPKTLNDYKGKTLAVDGYGWLHRAAYACCEEICLDIPTEKYIYTFLNRVDQLIRCNITPIMVFDGGHLPMKKETEITRELSRAKNKELALKYRKLGKKIEARRHFARAVNITPQMVYHIIQELKRRKIQYVVAPYEADAQLAYLSIRGRVDGIITDDSDCLAFGCHTVLYKLDTQGTLQEIRLEDLKRNEDIDLSSFTHDMFLDMCILSGCDYLQRIPKFGLKKAYTAMKQYGSFIQALRALRLQGKLCIPSSYEEDFERARMTFKHQRVYDSQLQKVTFLSPLPTDEIRTLDFLGPVISDTIATAIALGELDPISHMYFQGSGSEIAPNTAPCVSSPCVVTFSGQSATSTTFSNTYLKKTSGDISLSPLEDVAKHIHGKRTDACVAVKKSETAFSRMMDAAQSMQNVNKGQKKSSVVLKMLKKPKISGLCRSEISNCTVRKGKKATLQHKTLKQIRNSDSETSKLIFAKFSFKSVE